MDRRKTALKWLGWELFELPPEVAESLSEGDNLTYAKALITCAAGDGEISQQERDWIFGYLSVSGDSDEVLELVKTYDGGDSLEELFEQSTILREASNSMIYDALRACASDGELSAGERGRIMAAADRAGVSQQVVAELEQIVREEEALRRRRHELIVVPALQA